MIREVVFRCEFCPSRRLCKPNALGLQAAVGCAARGWAMLFPAGDASEMASDFSHERTWRKVFGGMTRGIAVKCR